MFQIALISEAQGQYTFILKNERSPYDSGVVVRIDRYRLETKKIKLGSRLIDSLTFEIKSLTREVYKSDSLISITDFENRILKKDKEDSKKTTERLSAILDKSLEAPKWYEKVLKSPWFWFGAGVVTTVTIKSR